MTLGYAKNEINRYLRIGVDKSDIACLVASWGLSISDMESANWYLHNPEIIDKTKDEFGERLRKDKL
jgi:hypothetical protein